MGGWLVVFPYCSGTKSRRDKSGSDCSGLTDCWDWSEEQPQMQEQLQEPKRVDSTPLKYASLTMTGFLGV